MFEELAVVVVDDIEDVDDEDDVEQVVGEEGFMLDKQKKCNDY